MCNICAIGWEKIRPSHLLCQLTTHVGRDQLHSNGARKIRRHFCVEKILTVPTLNENYGDDRPSNIGLFFQQTKRDGKNRTVDNFASRIWFDDCTSRKDEWVVSEDNDFPNAKLMSIDIDNEPAEFKYVIWYLEGNISSPCQTIVKE